LELVYEKLVSAKNHDGHVQQAWLKDIDDTVQMCHCENGM